MPTTTICQGDATTFAVLQSVAASDLPSGTPWQCATVGLAAQAASIGATTLWAVTVTGFYRISMAIKRTQIATTSSTLPSVTITWMDGDNSAAGSSAAIATNATNTLVAAVATQVVVYAKAGTNIQYSTAGYASVGATPLQYALRLKCEAL